MLAWTIYISFLGVLVLMLLPKGNASAARKVALLTAVAGFVVALAGFIQFKAGETVTVARVPWIPSLGIEYHLAADGISLTLVLLTGLAAIAGMASMGLPGFSGFVAELQVLIGVWSAYPTLAVICGIGILVGVAYVLRALQKAFFADGAVGQRNGGCSLEPISVPERVAAVLLLATTLVIGLYPQLLLRLIVPSFNSPLFDGLRKGGLM